MCASLVPITTYAFIFCRFYEACPPKVALLGPLSSVTYYQPVEDQGQAWCSEWAQGGFQESPLAGPVSHTLEPRGEQTACRSCHLSVERSVLCGKTRGTSPMGFMVEILF